MVCLPNPVGLSSCAVTLHGKGLRSSNQCSSGAGVDGQTIAKYLYYVTEACGVFLLTVFV